MLLKSCLILIALVALVVRGGKKLTQEERDAFEAATKDIFHLTSFNYDQVIKEGTWVVFYGLRACTHCTRFTPVWRDLELAKDVYKPIRLAKVECMAQDRSVIQLCDWVNGFPSVYLHDQGVFKEEMLGDLNYNLSLNWLKSMAVKYHPPNSTTVKEQKTLEISPIDKLKEIAGKGKEPAKDINPNGEVVHLTDQDFDEKTLGKVWFVMFHAPWCGHCKSLAPAWEELAKEVKGYINIGKVDATTESKLAQRFGIDRFPLLKFLRLPEMEPVPYTGDRSLKGLQDSVMKFVSLPFFTPITSLEIQKAKKEDEVAFFLVFNPIIMDSSILSNFEIAVRPWIGSVLVYVTPDTESYSLLGSKETKEPLLVVSKEHGLHLESYSSNFNNVGDLSAWIKAKKDPLLLGLDSSNQNQIFNGESLVVLALIDPEANKTSWSPVLQSVVKAWEHKDRPVIFVWLDAITHSGYVERVYSVKSTELPRLVIADPTTTEYYNIDSYGEKFVFDETKIPTYVRDIIDGKLAAQSSSGFLGKVARKMINSATYLSKVTSGNPWVPVIIILILVYVFYACIRIALSDYKPLPDSKKD